MEDREQLQCHPAQDPLAVASAVIGLLFNTSKGGGYKEYAAHRRKKNSDVWEKPIFFSYY
ncbi:MAG: hypothetical protein ACM3TN_16670 [Alphaproteobacteria bacterium]